VEYSKKCRLKRKKAWGRGKRGGMGGADKEGPKKDPDNRQKTGTRKKNKEV